MIKYLIIKTNIGLVVWTRVKGCNLEFSLLMLFRVLFCFYINDYFFIISLTVFNVAQAILEVCFTNQAFILKRISKSVVHSASLTN